MKILLWVLKLDSKVKKVSTEYPRRDGKCANVPPIGLVQVQFVSLFETNIVARSSLEWSQQVSTSLIKLKNFGSTINRYKEKRFNRQMETNPIPGNRHYLMNSDRNKLFKEIRLFGPESIRKRRRFRDGGLADRGQGLLLGDTLVINEVVVLLGFGQGLLDPTQPLLGVAQVRIMSTLNTRVQEALGVLKPEKHVKGLIKAERW